MNKIKFIKQAILIILIIVLATTTFNNIVIIATYISRKINIIILRNILIIIGFLGLLVGGTLGYIGALNREKNLFSKSVICMILSALMIMLGDIVNQL